MSEAAIGFWGAVLGSVVGGVIAAASAFGAIRIEHVLTRREQDKRTIDDSLVEILAAGQSHAALLQRLNAVIGHSGVTAQQALTEIGLAHAALLERVMLAHSRLRTLTVPSAKQVAADAVVADISIHNMSPPNDRNQLKVRITELYGDLNALIDAIDGVKPGVRAGSSA